MMDFLDPKKTRANTIRLYVGYVLLAIAIVLAAIVLMYQAGGFGVNSEGKVIQNGLIFASSSPSGAQLYLDGQRNNNDTNARLTLPSGTYTMRLTRDGYRDWQRALTIEGGSVEHIDYPLLIPTTLTPATVGEYKADTPLAMQSPDRRWLLMQIPGEASSFDVYDTKDPKKVKTQKTIITLPATVLGLTSQPGQQTFKLAEWSRDNDHVLLQHVVGQQSEYILLSRTKPETSVNLSKQLQLKAGDEVTMRDKKYDRYFVHDVTAKTLGLLDLNGQSAKTLLNNVVTYKTYGEDVVLYATSEGADPGKIAVKLYQYGTSYPIRQVAAGAEPLLDLSTYSNDWYAVVGAASEDHVYIYKNPAQSLRSAPDEPLIPADILKLANPNYLEFSANSQFAMIESGQDLAVYDVENERSFVYHIDKPLDAPQQHVTWMDGYHLTLVSGGSAMIFDYDGTNIQNLVSATPAFTPFFDTSYQTLYTIAPGTVDPAQPGAGASSIVNATSLRTERDR